MFKQKKRFKQKKTIVSKIKINHTKSTQKNDVKKNKTNHTKSTQKNDVKKNKNKPHKIHTKTITSESSRINSTHKIHRSPQQHTAAAFLCSIVYIPTFSRSPKLSQTHL